MIPSIYHDPTTYELKMVTLHRNVCLCIASVCACRDVKHMAGGEERLVETTMPTGVMTGCFPSNPSSPHSAQQQTSGVRLCRKCGAFPSLHASMVAFGGNAVETVTIDLACRPCEAASHNS